MEFNMMTNKRITEGKKCKSVYAVYKQTTSLINKVYVYLDKCNYLRHSYLIFTTE